MATIAVNLPLNIGVSGTYLLFLYNGSTLLNSGGDTLTEVANGYYTATVAETVVATVTYRADVTRNGTLIYSGWLQSGVSSVVDDPGANVKAVLGVAVTPTSLPVDANVTDIDSGVLNEIAAAVQQAGQATPGFIPSTAVVKTIRRNDSYDGTANALYSFTVDKNYTGWTGTFTIRHRVTNASLLSKSVTVASSTLLTCSLSSSDTAFALLATDAEFGPHPFDVEMTNGGSEQTAQSGVVVVTKDVG